MIPRLPPPVVLGSGVTLLGVVRVLGRQGMPLRASVSPGDFVERTRWLPRRWRLPSTDAVTSLTEYLERLPMDGGFLIPCGDHLALQAAELPQRLADRYVSYQPEPAILRLLIDKGRFLETLRANDVPHPETHVVEALEDLEALPDDALQAAFIKPRDSQRFQQEYGVKGFRPTARADFRSRLAQLLEEGHGLMIQQYVPGPASDHYFIDGFATEGGEIATLFARRRLRMYPTDFGNSTYMASIALEDVRPAVDSLMRLLRALGYRGIFSAEFKHDASDGQFRIIEINARPWWYVEFAARAGIDVVKLAYRAAFGLPLNPPTHYQVGRKFVYPYYDYFACRAELPGRGAALRRFLADTVGADQPVFAWDDPLPAVGHWVHAIPRMASRRLRPRRGATG